MRLVFPQGFARVRLALFLAALLPLARLFWLGAGDGLGANPVEFVTRSTGTWALVFLCQSLAMTPLRRLTGDGRWLRLRRMLGLYCFFYAGLHVGLWLWVEHAFSLLEMLRDVGRRPFIAAGFAAFVLLVPLAATSNTASIRRLGVNWQRLHRLVYLIAVAAILHYGWHKAGKNDLAPVLPYALTVAGLLGVRLWWALAARLQGKRDGARREGERRPSRGGA